MAKYEESPELMLRRLLGEQGFDQSNFQLNEEQRAIDRRREMLTLKRDTHGRKVEGMSFFQGLEAKAHETRQKQKSKQSGGGSGIESPDIQAGMAAGSSDPRTSTIGDGLMKSIDAAVGGGETKTTENATAAATMAEFLPPGQRIPGDEARLAPGGGVMARGEGVNAANPAAGRPDLRTDTYTSQRTFGGSRAGVLLTGIFHVIGKGTQTNTVTRDVSITPYQQAMLDMRAKESRAENARYMMRDYGMNAPDAIELHTSIVNGDLAMGNVPEEKLEKWGKLRTISQRREELRFGLEKKKFKTDEMLADLTVMNTLSMIRSREMQAHVAATAKNHELAPSFLNMLGYTGESFKGNESQLAEALKEATDTDISKMSSLEVEHLAARVAAAHGSVMTFSKGPEGWIWPAKDIAGDSMPWRQWANQMDVATGRSKVDEPSRVAVMEYLKSLGLAEIETDENGVKRLIRMRSGPQVGYSAQLFNTYETFADGPVGDLWRNPDAVRQEQAQAAQHLRLPESVRKRLGPAAERFAAPTQSLRAQPLPAQVAPAAKQAAERKVKEDRVIDLQKSIPETQIHPDLLRVLDTIL